MRDVPAPVLSAAKHEVLGRPSLVYSFVDNAGVAWQRDNRTGGLRERPTPESGLTRRGLTDRASWRGTQGSVALTDEASFGQDPSACS
jgi:hypothetical protein